MKKRLVFLGEARREFDQAFDWYESRRAGLGVRFAREVSGVLERIAGHPMHFPAVHGKVRKAVVASFPYCVFFRIEGKRIRVIAVFDSRRDPAEWRRRAES